MANTYTLISSVTVGAGGASTITFSSIPQIYTDLLVKISARTSYAGGADAYLQFQGGGGTSNYTWKKLQGDGGSASSYGGTNQGQASPWTLNGTFTANTFSNSEFYIPNYTGSTYKSFGSDSVAENNGTSTYTTLAANIWQQTAAITDIVLSVASGFTQYSTVYLYGIKNS